MIIYSFLIFLLVLWLPCWGKCDQKCLSALKAPLVRWDLALNILMEILLISTICWLAKISIRESQTWFAILKKKTFQCPAYHPKDNHVSQSHSCPHENAANRITHSVSIQFCKAFVSYGGQIRWGSNLFIHVPESPGS